MPMSRTVKKNRQMLSLNLRRKNRQTRNVVKEESYLGEVYHLRIVSASEGVENHDDKGYEQKVLTYKS